MYRLEVGQDLGVAEPERSSRIFDVAVKAVGQDRVDAVTGVAALIGAFAFGKVVGDGRKDARVAIDATRSLQMQFGVGQIGMGLEHARFGGIR